MSKKTEENIFENVNKEIEKAEQTDVVDGKEKEEKAPAKTPAKAKTKEVEAPTVVEGSDEDFVQKMKSRLDIVGILYPENATKEMLVELFNDRMSELNNTVKPTEVEDLLRKYNREQGTRLIRLRIFCNDPTRYGRKGEIIAVRNRTVGNLRKHIPYNTDAMAAGYHVPFAMYEHLRSVEFYPPNTVKNKYGMDEPTKVAQKLFTIEILEPLTQEEIDTIAKRQLATRKADM